jgi:hypothetical protein
MVRKQKVIAEIDRLTDLLKIRTENFLFSCPLVGEFHEECIQKQKDYMEKLEVYKKSRGIN